MCKLIINSSGRHQTKRMLVKDGNHFSKMLMIRVVKFLNAKSKSRDVEMIMSEEMSELELLPTSKSKQVLSRILFTQKLSAISAQME